MDEATVSALTTAVNSVESSVSTGVATVLPAGLSIMALMLGIKLSIGFFRSIAH